MLSNSGVLHPYKFNENWNKHESWSTTEWIMMSFSKEQFLTFRKSQCLVWSLVFVSMVTSQSLHKHRNITAGVEGLVFSCIGQRSISKTVSMSSQTELLKIPHHDLNSNSSRFNIFRKYELYCFDFYINEAKSTTGIILRTNMASIARLDGKVALITGKC